MSMYSPKNAGIVIVSSPALDILAAGAGVIIKRFDDSSIAAGQLAIVDGEGLVYDNVTITTALERFRIVQSDQTNNTLIYSDWIYRNQVDSISVKGQIDATQRIEVFGSNGTSGSLDVIDNNDYRVTIFHKHFENMPDKMFDTSATYTSDSTCTQEKVALNLVKTLNAKLMQMVSVPIRAKVLFDTAVTVANNITSAGTLYFTKGSKVVIVPGLTYTGGTVAVGNFIRIHDTDATVVVTDDVYKITGITGTTQLTLDRPYSGPTHSDTAADNAGDEIIPAVLAPSNWGVRLEGQAQTDWKLGDINYQVYDFSTVLRGFTTNTVTVSVSASKGCGEHQEVAETEFEGRMEWQLKTRLGVPVPTFRAFTVNGTDYEYICINYYDGNYTDISGQQHRSKKELLIGCPVNQLDNLLAALTTWSPVTITGTVGGLFPAPA